MRMTMTYDGRIISGYILRLASTASAGEDRIKQFMFTVLVEKEGWVRMNDSAKGLVMNYISNAKRLGTLKPVELPTQDPMRPNPNKSSDQVDPVTTVVDILPKDPIVKDTIGTVRPNPANTQDSQQKPVTQS